ncbi:BTB/POZ domain-containing protein [Rhynchospora pubera]|uniref:BTB/POZ domain-containing protein n=1 Tax=Rhynchospora pubera TaxID=906938 RepID=A0AAV8E6C9_9POAL|nr:BTB/POZ domain-containing protein [Rhynchospora pubera]
MSSLPSPSPPPPPSVAPIPLPPLQPHAADMRQMDCNLASLCDHIRADGFASGAFSDVAVHAMGSTYSLHRLILSRCAYFRNMLHGPWKEAGAPTVVLQIDDPNVNSEAISICLAYIYGQSPKLNDTNAYRVLAAASFLDLQDLCAICTEFITSELWTSNFLQYQVFAESQDYGMHGERVRSACWGYLCQSATMELREVLPKLSAQTLHALITSDELWVPNEEKRFELALYTLLAKGTISDDEESSSSIIKGKTVIGTSSSETLMESELLHLQIQDNLESHKTAQSNRINLADCMAEFQSGVPFSNVELNGVKAKRNPADPTVDCPSPSSDPSGYKFNESIWPRDCSSTSPAEEPLASIPLWANGAGRRQVKNNASAKGCSCLLPSDEYDAFMNIFEGGSLLYCNMSFEALLNVRKQLEEFGFPCKALNDGLWLQMLLCHRVQAVVADTCRSCCLTSNLCACRQAYGYSHGGGSSVSYYRQDHDRSTSPCNSSNNIIGNIYLSEAQGDGGSVFGASRVHRGAADGLAGIGRGSTSPGSSAAWAPTRFVFSRVPVGLGTRNESETARLDHNAEISGDGLTVLVGLSEERVYEPSSTSSRFGGPAGAVSGMSGTQVQMVDSREGNGLCLGPDWEISEESQETSTVSLDFKTPLSHFPPFRFGVEFEDVHRLTDGQVKHSPEVFYAGSLWKVSVQAFSDEDPQGRRTLGLFLHRRKAELTDHLRKVHMYIDSREKVTARYKLICPSKREVMVFGNLKQAGTLLPKAPKGWGWRTAFLFDELADLLQGGSLRIAAAVQVI